MGEVTLVWNPGRFLDRENFSGYFGSWGGDGGLFLFGPRAWIAALGQTYIVLVHGSWGCSSSLLKTV